MSDLKGIPLAKRYEIIETITDRYRANKAEVFHHKLCEVTAGRKLGYWAEDLCDCKKEPECNQSP